MYLVRDKTSKEIIHVNPAPLSQALQDSEVYFKFDPSSMEIAKTDFALPEHFDVDDDGYVIEVSLEEQVARGVLKLNPLEKIEKGNIVRKSVAEQVEEGIVKLGSNQKIVGGEIVEKTLEEQVSDGLIELPDDQKVSDDEIVEKNLQELLDDKLITLAEIKQQKIEHFSSQALIKRNAILPEYKIQNALMGVYDDDRLDGYKETISAFRNEFHRLKSEVQKAKSLKAIESIKEKFPDQLVSESEKAPAKKKARRSRS